MPERAQACFDAHAAHVGAFHRARCRGRARSTWTSRSWPCARSARSSALQRRGRGEPGAGLDAAGARALPARAADPGGALPGAVGRGPGLVAARAARGLRRPRRADPGLLRDRPRLGRARLELFRASPRVMAQSRALGIPFGVLFWASNKKTATTDADWRRGLMRQGRKYRRAGIVPDLYDINDFMVDPASDRAGDASAIRTRIRSRPSWERSSRGGRSGRIPALRT